jgi:hypothetical protein
MGEGRKEGKTAKKEKERGEERKGEVKMRRVEGEEEKKGEGR